MSEWRFVIDVKIIFALRKQEVISYEKARDGIVDTILTSDAYSYALGVGDEDVVDILEDLARSSSVQEFDAIWNVFYDWCDEERVWVKTR